VQSRAIEEQSHLSRTSSSSSDEATRRRAVHGVPKASQGLQKLKLDLLELEDYIPWNAVATNWANRRTVWARRLRECPDTSGVIKHLLQLEQHVNLLTPPRL
jgi:hypothetical protein